MNRETYCLLENYMLRCMQDSAHDKEHVYRVLYHALEIAKEEGGVDYDVLITACLLHDIGRKEQFENPAVCHATAGGDKAYRFLVSEGFERHYAERVKFKILHSKSERACGGKTAYCGCVLQLSVSGGKFVVPEREKRAGQVREMKREKR